MPETKQTNDSLPQVAAFVQTVRQGGFAAAGRKLGLSASAVGKSVTRMEQRLGVKLLNRTTRSVALTEIGEAVFGRYTHVLELLKEVDLLAGQDAQTLSGTLKLDLPKVYGARVIGPMLARFASLHPGISLDIRLNDEVCHLVEEGVDLAVRIGTVADSDLIARPLDRQRLVVVASKEYLARYGTPQKARALGEHQCLGFRSASTGRLRPWLFKDESGVDTSLALDHRYRFDEGIAIKRAAEAGLGVAQLPSYMVRRAVKEGTLVRLLDEFRPGPTPIQLIYTQKSKHNVRLQALVNFLLDEARQGRFGPS
ncbi:MULTISPECIES: LysR family transcriptional regulator [unclassified Vreelandella]